MYRFVAFSWSSRDSKKASTAGELGRSLISSSPCWDCVFSAPGMHVFHAPQDGGAFHEYVLKRNTGVILGRLFDGELEGSIPSDPIFDDNESDSVIESEGRRIIERYWGHFVAFLRTPDGVRRFVIRDPLGGLPCYLTTVAGIDVIVSDVDDCAALRGARFSIDWDHLTASFVHNRLITRSTGLKEVSQVHAGECVTIEDEARLTRTFYWDPADVYRADVIEDPTVARAALRGAIWHCVNAWAGCYKSIVHELSGGLDSSIVAACLGKGTGNAEVLCFNFFTKKAQGDEREYARAAARSAGCELIECEAPLLDRTLESLLSSRRVATPGLLGFLPASELSKQHLVSERHAGAIFTGQGGDHLFQQEKSEHSAGEYVYRHGIRPQLLEIVANTSRLTKRPMLSVFLTAASHGLQRRIFKPYRVYETPSILSDSACASLSRDAFTHPWVEKARRLPPSKLQQILNLVDCQSFFIRPCPTAEQIHPLISLPIVERCLQIPTYVLTHRGRDRGLVRESFEEDLPTKIVHRYTKGGTASYFNRLLIANVCFLRGFLLDGALVRNSILDRSKLEKELSERELILGKSLQPIVHAARAEKWLSTWADVRH